MKFLCDQMLGTLAKWLRILGFDTYYANADVDDAYLLKIAKKEKRVLITRDKKLVWDARRENVENIMLESVDLDEQISKVLDHVEISKENILSRCTLCNTKIEDIEKDDVKNKVPKHVFDSHKKFFYCPVCNKVYWKGSHFEKILKKVENIK